MTDDSVRIPYYDDAIDVKALWEEFPPPPHYFGTIDRLSRDELRALQERRFLQQVEHAWTNPFYRRRWSAVGLQPGDIKGLGDLECIPPFTVADLRESIERMPPFGDYMGHDPRVDAPMPLVMQTSSGTTGLPRPMLFAPRDREVMNIMRARCMYSHGVRPNDLVQITHAFGLSNAGMSTRETIWKYSGAIPVTTGAGTSTPTVRQIEILQAWKASVLVGFPAYIRHMGQVARDELGIDPRGLSVRHISTHLGTEDRSQLEELWNAKAYDTYGSSEAGVVAAECSRQAGMHVYEDAHLVEIIDLGSSGRHVADGKRGTIVLTSLFKHLAPLIRFNVNDVSEFETRACACGSTHRRLRGIFGRSDNMVKLRGINVYPEAIGAVLAAAIPTTGEYICIVDKVGDTNEMTVMVEVNSPSQVDEGLRDRLERHLKNTIGVRIRAQLVPPRHLADLTGLSTNTPKARRLIDNTNTDAAKP